MPLFCCPVCGKPLRREPTRCLCPAGHCFDAAREGYVHLLPANRMRAKAPGDSPQMVEARSRFLSAGYYRPLADAIAEAACRMTCAHPAVLDCGCGEGYYTEAVYAALHAAGRTPHIAGIDISKPAVRRAAKRLPDGMFAVASAFRLPVADASCDLILSCFAPYDDAEILRVLKPGGCFLRVTPGPLHLFALKRAVYEHPYENPAPAAPPEGLHETESRTLTYQICLPDHAAVADLFSMTPYLHKTGAEGLARLAALPSLETEASFLLGAFQKDGSARPTLSRP